MIESDHSPAERFAALLQRLETEGGACRVGSDAVDGFAAATGDTVLLLTDAPQRCPEAWDMAVVLPELVRALGGRLQAGFADPEASAAIAARYAVSRFPALLFQRCGGYVGAIEGMRDWSILVSAAADFLAAPVGRAPGVGVPVRAVQGAACH